jgi:hypothetical protein
VVGRWFASRRMCAVAVWGFAQADSMTQINSDPSARSTLAAYAESSAVEYTIDRTDMAKSEKGKHANSAQVFYAVARTLTHRVPRLMRRGVHR